MRQLCELADTFKALGVDLVVLDQAIDTSTPSGKLLFDVLAAVAEFEAGLIRERTRAGLEAARRRGRPPELLVLFAVAWAMALGAAAEWIGFSKEDLIEGPSLGGSRERRDPDAVKYSR